MLEDYITLKTYNFSKNSKFLILIIILTMVLILASNMKVKTYVSYSYIKGVNENYLVCQNNCDDIINNHQILINSKPYHYKFIKKIDNLYQIQLQDKTPVRDIKNAGIYHRKISTYEYLFSIFKKKGVT